MIWDEIDRKLLLTIIEKYQGGPVGREHDCCGRWRKKPDAIEEIYEPFLIQIGFLNRTPRGRVATHLAYEHFGIMPTRRQSSCVLMASYSQRTANCRKHRSSVSPQDLCLLQAVARCEVSRVASAVQNETSRALFT